MKMSNKINYFLGVILYHYVKECDFENLIYKDVIDGSKEINIFIKKKNGKELKIVISFSNSFVSNKGDQATIHITNEDSTKEFSILCGCGKSYENLVTLIGIVQDRFLSKFINISKEDIDDILSENQ